MTGQSTFRTPRSSGVSPRQQGYKVGSDVFERVISHGGFVGPTAAIYHRNPPSAWESIEGSIQPHLFDTSLIADSVEAPWEAPELLYNDDVRIRFWRTNVATNDLFKNVDGDDLLFVHRGGGEMFCEFGHLTLVEGDYLVLPRDCAWRFEPAEHSEILMIESTDAPYRPPELNWVTGRYVPFDPGVLDVPEIDDAFAAQRGKHPRDIVIKRGNQLSRIKYPYNPLDAVGWQGDVYPVRLNIDHLIPIGSPRAFLAPSSGCTFMSDQFMITTLKPMPSVSDPDAAKLPVFHSNCEYEEVLFVHRGQMKNRPSFMKEGGMTYHPSGMIHGPHPGALHMLRAAKLPDRTNTVIMIDTRHRLNVSRHSAGFTVPEYRDSWRASIELAPDVVSDASL